MHSEATRLDFANKQLKSLKGISKCRNLTWLDISGNLLDSLQWIKKLKNLNVLKASNNNITAVSHLSNLTDLKALILNNNKLESLDGIEGLLHLNALVLSHNQLKNVDVSSFSNLSKLSLSHNKLTIMPDLQNVKNLKELRLNDNKIKKLSDTLTNCKRLRLVDLGNNKISDFKFLDILSKVPVENLNLKGNEICCHKDYHSKIKTSVRSLKVLDGHRIDATPSKIFDSTSDSFAEKVSLIQEKDESFTDSSKNTDTKNNNTKFEGSQHETKTRKSGGFVSKIVADQIFNETAKQAENINKKKDETNRKRVEKTKGKLEGVTKEVEMTNVKEKGKLDKRKRKLVSSGYDEDKDGKEGDKAVQQEECQLDEGKRKKSKKIKKDKVGVVENEMDQDKSEKNARQGVDAENEGKKTERHADVSSTVENGDTIVEANIILEPEERIKSNKMKKDKLKKQERLTSKKDERKKKRKKKKEINSRSGVVAVELLKSRGNKKDKSREDVLKLTSSQSHEFGTGEASSW